MDFKSRWIASKKQLRCFGVLLFGVTAFAVTSTSAEPEINLQGNSTNIADGETVTSTSDDTDFGDVDTSSGGIAHTFTIQNTGLGVLSIGAITIEGTDASDYSITNDPASNVASSGSTTFEVTFDPSADGERTATVSIVNDDSDENPYSFALTGNGTRPEIRVAYRFGNSGSYKTIFDGDTSTSFDNGTNFGDVNAISGSRSRTFRIFNHGNGELSVGDITISGDASADFSVTSDPSENVAGSGGTSFDVTFSPSVDGVRDATISIVNGDADENPYNFAITGTGTAPEIDVQGNNMSILDGETATSASDDTYFGIVNTVSGTEVHTFTIQNTGNGALTLGTITIGGTDASDFTVTSNPSSNVAMARDKQASNLLFVM